MPDIEDVIEKPKKRRAKGGGRQRKEYNHTFHIKQDVMEEEIEILAPLSIKQEKYLNDTENDVIVWGGSAAAGKTHLSLLMIMLNAMYDEHYVAAIARQSQKQMRSAGSLFTTGIRMFTKHGVRTNKSEMVWDFPSGAEVKCHHLDDNQDDWQGTQCTHFLVDEAQQCKEDDVWYLQSRLRSRSQKKHQLRLTCNPLNNSYLCRWLEKAGYLDEDGYPIKERDGVTTWMAQINGEFLWFNSEAEVKDQYGKDIARTALKFVFYAANVYDNPYIRKHRPEYVTKLENLKPVDKARLLDGCWYASEQANGFIKREFFKEVQRADIPVSLPTVRCWDFAATKPHAGNKNPDWTRGVKASYDKETATFYILGMESVRDRAAVVQSLVETTAFTDGKGVYVGIPQDAGGAGSWATESRTASLNTMGYKVYTNSARKSKIQRAEPFIIALQEGRVKVAMGVFNEIEYSELEYFDGARNSGYHDDIMDAIADCYNLLTSGRLIPVVNITSQTSHRLNRLGGRTLLI